MTLFQARVNIARELRFTGEGEAEAAEILYSLTGLSYSEQVLRGQAVFDGQAAVAEIIEKRCRGVPLAYILKSKHFCGMQFYVDERVLIPRADSECVAIEAARIGRRNGCQSLLDLCCGSGCLGVAVANRSGAKRVAFADISAGALSVAKENAALLNSANVIFYTSDLFCGFEDKFDLIVCNPPYISSPEYAALEPGVKDFEPKAALLAGNTGTEFYRRICGQVKDYLNPGGAIVFEIGYNQCDAVQRIMRDNGIEILNAGCDIAGRPRFLTGAVIK